MPFITTLLHSQFFVTPPVPTASFSGQTIIVTGSNVGLGFEAARHITRLGASKAIIACRTVSKGEKAKEDILSSTKRQTDCIEVWELDLSDYESIKAFAKRASGLERLDGVIESAGVSNTDWVMEGDEEQTIKVNVISTLLLALLLLPKLRETGQKYATTTHLEVVTSEMHHFATIGKDRADDLYGVLGEEARTRSGSFSERYPLSKLLEIMFVQELVERTPSSPKPNPVITLVNPGFCYSNLVKLQGVRAMVFNMFRMLLARTAEVGSRTLVAGIVAGKESHGKYMSDGLNQDYGIVGWLKTEEGKVKQRKVYEQTLKVLERIEPGIGRNV